MIKISDKNGRIKSGPTYKRSRLPVSFTKSNADKEKIKPVKREPVSPANILELLPKLKFMQDWQNQKVVKTADPELPKIEKTKTLT